MTKDVLKFTESTFVCHLHALIKSIYTFIVLIQPKQNSQIHIQVTLRRISVHEYCFLFAES